MGKYLNLADEALSVVGQPSTGRPGNARSIASSVATDPRVSESDCEKSERSEKRVPDPGPGALPEAWRDWHADKVIEFTDKGYGPAEAMAVAYGYCVDQWHRIHGARPPEGRCAGCGGRLEGEVLHLPDMSVVHYGASPGCLIAYGSTWRHAAAAGLKALGVEPPAKALVRRG
jgi:hypothetical protein